MDTSCVEVVGVVHFADVRQTGAQYTWRVPAAIVTDVTRLVASDEKTACAAAPSIEGSELGPLDAAPLGATVTDVAVGVHDAVPRQVSRTKTSLEPLV